MKVRVAPELLKKIKDSVNLIEVVGEHVVLRKSGSNHSGLCPFHSERTPSFSVSEGKQLYHCYGCKKGGDLVNFVMEIHGITFPEAIEELAERARIPLPKEWDGMNGASDDPEVQKRRAAAREKLNTAYKLNRFAAAFYHQSLPQLAHAAEYFDKRGASDDLSRAFYIGASPPSWDGLATHLVAKQAPLPLAMELGLIRPSQNARAGGPGYFDLFRNRAMFPILDMRGKVVGFGGRTLPVPAGAPDTGSDGPKYMNSPESFIFQKSKLVFGLYQAQKHIREKDEIILVEGYFDVLGLHAAGFQNAVATCGTALTPDHLALFKRFASRVIILFDGDKAGVSATERAMELGLDHGWVLHGAVLPEGLDPDEVLLDPQTGRPSDSGREKMTDILRQARPILEAGIQDAVQAAAKGPEERTQAVKQIGAWLGRFRDPVGREVWIQSAIEQLKIERALLNRAMGVATPQATSRPPERPPAPPTLPQGRPVPRRQPVRNRLNRWEVHLLKGWVLSRVKGQRQGPEFAELLVEARDKLPPGKSLLDLFEHPLIREFLQNESSDLDQAIAAAAPENPIRALVMEVLMSSDSSVSADSTGPFGGGVGVDEFKTAIGFAVGRVWARFSQQIKAAIAEAEARKDAGLQASLMKDYLDVQRKMKEFRNSYEQA